MKKILSGIIAISLFAACSGNSNTTAANTGTAAGKATIKFENDAFDFGKINQGDKVTHEYKFKNEGSAPLIITDSYATCGCTKPEWPHTPVKPGDSGVVKVTFSSEGKVGLQDKQITVVANTAPDKTVVHLVGEVIEKKK